MIRRRKQSACCPIWAIIILAILIIGALAFALVWGLRDKNSVDKPVETSVVTTPANDDQSSREEGEEKPKPSTTTDGETDEGDEPQSCLTTKNVCYSLVGLGALSLLAAEVGARMDLLSTNWSPWTYFSTWWSSWGTVNTDLSGEDSGFGYEDADLFGEDVRALDDTKTFGRIDKTCYVQRLDGTRDDGFRCKISGSTPSDILTQTGFYLEGGLVTEGPVQNGGNLQSHRYYRKQAGNNAIAEDLRCEVQFDRNGFGKVTDIHPTLRCDTPEAWEAWKGGATTNGRRSFPGSESVKNMRTTDWFTGWF